MALKPFVIKSEKETSTNNPHLNVVDAQLMTPTGKDVTWSYIKTNVAVGILAMDSEKNVYLKREWRLNQKEFVWELPAGFVEEENPTEEQIQAAANRELQEEVGMKANTLEKLVTFYPSNHMSMIAHVYLGTDLENSKLKADEHEYLEVRKLPIHEAYTLVTTNQIPTALTLIAFEMMFKRERNRV